MSYSTSAIEKTNNVYTYTPTYYSTGESACNVSNNDYLKANRKTILDALNEAMANNFCKKELFAPENLPWSCCESLFPNGTGCNQRPQEYPNSAEFEDASGMIIENAPYKMCIIS